MLFKAVCFIVSAHLVGRGFHFPIESKLQTWNLADHQALPSLVFLPSSICSGSSNVTPASVVLLSTSLSALPPPPPLVSPLPPFTQLMPRYTGMHACTHPLHIPALPPSLAFPKHKTKKISFIFLILGSLAEAHISSPALDLTLKCYEGCYWWILFKKNYFASVVSFLFMSDFLSKWIQVMEVCLHAALPNLFPPPCFCFLRLSSFFARLLVACLAFALRPTVRWLAVLLQPSTAAVSYALSRATVHLYLCSFFFCVPFCPIILLLVTLYFLVTWSASPSAHFLPCYCH